MRKLDARKLAREKSLFRYSSALERADFATVEAVLQEAERDPVLAEMITEINTVYESETIRLSPSLNHSSNHQQKELLMTTIILPRRQSNLQRWLPVTLAAACVSVLFIGALLMRPLRPNGNSLVGLQAGSTATPTAAASPTLVPTELPTFTPTPVAEVGAANPTIVPPLVVQPAEAQPSVSAIGTPVCGGIKIITEDTLVHGQPSNRSSVIGRVPAGTQVETLLTGNAAEGDTSVPKTQWFFIKAEVDGNSVQGWISANIALPLDLANPCPSSDVTVFSEVVPANAVPLATIVPANPILVPTVIPADAQPVFSTGTVPACSAITFDGTTPHIINQVDKAATIYAAPLTINSNASIVGELPAKAEATLLYQQYDRQSDPIGALWYLIMTDGKGEKQVTGWISANSVTATDPCATLTVDATGTTAIAPIELQTITGVAMPSSAQIGTCRVTNLNTQPVTVFAAPLTADSNAPVVGTFPVQGDAVVIFQNYDQQSAPVGTLWYLVSVTGVNQPAITGWVSANSINSTNACAPEQLVGVSPSSVTISAGGMNAVAVPSLDISAPSMCQITNTTGEAIKMFAAPITSNSKAPVVGDFPANGEALVILQSYDGSSDRTSALWYLITMNNQLTGWISGNNLYLSDGCGTAVTAVSEPVPANVETQADAAIAPVASGVMPAGICTVSVQQNDSVQVFSGSSQKGDESLLVNNLPANMPATVLYQRLNKDTGVTWYLILAVAKEGKEISGWVSSDSVKVIGNCPSIP